MAVLTEEKLVEEILKSPSVYNVLGKVKNKLDEEKEKRKVFYETITEQEKAEFINGETIVHSPVVKFHNEVNLNLGMIINAYTTEHNLGFVGIEKILLQFERNDYEPDLCFFNKKIAVTFTKDQMFFPVPDMIVEVLSKSTEKRDRGIKYDDYESHGVKEYWIVDPDKELVEQYINKNQQYELMLKSNSGNVGCFVLKGLTIPIETIFNRALTHQFVKQIIN